MAELKHNRGRCEQSAAQEFIQRTAPLTGGVLYATQPIAATRR